MSQDVSGWKNFKTTMPYACCHRPPGKVHGFPVTLQVRAFGEFVDALKIVANQHHQRMTLDLMRAMTGVYDSEAERQREFCLVFMRYGFQLTPTGSAVFKCDLFIMGSVNHKVVANIELKPELGIGNKTLTSKTLDIICIKLLIQGGEKLSLNNKVCHKMGRSPNISNLNLSYKAPDPW